MKKLNIVIGATPPPGAIVFKADGAIESVPDAPKEKASIPETAAKEQDAEDREE